LKTSYTLDSSGKPVLSDDNNVGFPNGRAYYVTDTRGNLTQLLDAAQNVKAVFAYDDFGKQKSALTQTSANGSSTWDSRLRYQLAPRDQITGQYAIGPRMFDPGTYRFIGADQYVGSGANQELQADPLTGNRYLYAGSNPANYIDDGHAPQCQDCADFASGVINGVLFNTGEPVERALGIHDKVNHASGWRDAGEWTSIVVPGGIAVKGAKRGWTALKSAMKARNAATAARQVLPRSGPIARSLGAASRSEQLARKFNLNVNSPTTRQVLNSLDDSVADFVANYRKGSLWRKLPGEVADMTVEEALKHSSTVRKLLTDKRFAK
ncbi:MAG: RHS repeat-associated core domain-containing protein, partial [Acidimicrobiales bacterium]